MSHLPVLRLILDELLYSHHAGFVVDQDDGDGRRVKVEVKVVLTFIMYDYRGLAYFKGDSIKQSPAFHACFKCWHHGRSFYKTVYNTHLQ